MTVVLTFEERAGWLSVIGMYNPRRNMRCGKRLHSDGSLNRDLDEILTSFAFENK
jgi:hypothetical protein